MTNFERIKSLNVTALAERMANNCDITICAFCRCPNDDLCGYSTENCIEGIRAWLESEEV